MSASNRNRNQRVLITISVFALLPVAWITTRYGFAGTLRPQTNVVCARVPEPLKDLFSRPGAYSYRFSREEQARDSLFETGEHPDLVVSSPDRLASKKYGWSIYLPYKKRIVAETEKAWAIETSHSFTDGWSLFTPYRNRYYVIRKSDGSIRSWRETEIPGVTKIGIADGGLFLMHDDDFPKVFKLEIRE